jgi:hypothetical protein
MAWWWQLGATYASSMPTSDLAPRLHPWDQDKQVPTYGWVHDLAPVTNVTGSFVAGPALASVMEDQRFNLVTQLGANSATLFSARFTNGVIDLGSASDIYNASAAFDLSIDWAIVGQLLENPDEWLAISLDPAKVGIANRSADHFTDQQILDSVGTTVWGVPEPAPLCILVLGGLSMKPWERRRRCRG